MIVVAATVYSFGKAFFWPTSLGVVAEQSPRGGAITLNVVAGIGMLGAGVIGGPLIGQVLDRQVVQGVAAYDAKKIPPQHVRPLAQEAASYRLKRVL